MTMLDSYLFSWQIDVWHMSLSLQKWNKTFWHYDIKLHYFKTICSILVPKKFYFLFLNGYICTWIYWKGIFCSKYGWQYKCIASPKYEIKHQKLMGFGHNSTLCCRTQSRRMSYALLMNLLIHVSYTKN